MRRRRSWGSCGRSEPRRGLKALVHSSLISQRWKRCATQMPVRKSVRRAQILAALGGQPRRLSPHDLCQPQAYFVITPQAMRSPELPEGSVFISSASAWMTMAVPPLLNSEWVSSPS